MQKPKLMKSINPATGELLKQFDELSERQIDEKLSLAARTFDSYRHSHFEERTRWLLKAALLLEKESGYWAKMMTVEMGKPVNAARDEVEKCARCCRFYAENAEKFLADETVQTQADRSFVRFQPLGPVLAVMPWNFPFWQVFRFAAPALMAGNVGILKHASNVPDCALAIQEIFERADFPQGVFQTLLIGSQQVQRLIEDPRIKAVTLTGSDTAGSKVAAAAGRVIKKTVLELGGSDPFIVMPSAPLDEAVATAVKARMINNGQSCIAAKRFFVHERIYAEFERRFVEKVKALRVGNPLEDGVQIGPLATRELVETLDEQVRESVKAGASVLVGGSRQNGPGNFYSPTVLTNIPKDSPAYKDEIFGPVAALFRVKSLEEGIRLANESRYGLGSCLWSQDPKEQEQFINDIEAGASFVNGMVASDPKMPFGGVKASGYGRELSYFGIREFVNIKTVWIKENPGSEQMNGAETVNSSE